jgi:hypothetical protein
MPTPADTDISISPTQLCFLTKQTISTPAIILTVRFEDFHSGDI